ncbi:MAG: hypothetical protein ACD_28C00048G0006 [uncultured bacterium]|nr:MAG: hypothetical protein ACD_28C00048G0006 [uncultured bacterium]KKT76926.1 MAG: hypothetical protein UW70_C0008G0009 [Candidatus Peregrinibacteria bacterium GW2011_GWA2_44_7]
MVEFKSGVDSEPHFVPISQGDFLMLDHLAQQRIGNSPRAKSFIAVISQ